jgi:hypothetical protein
MKLDELVPQGASRRDHANRWLVEPGRVKFAALNRGVFLVLLQVRPTSDTQSSWSKKLWSHPFSLEISSWPFTTRVFRECPRTRSYRPLTCPRLTLPRWPQCRPRERVGSPVDIDRNAQVVPSKTNAWRHGRQPALICRACRAGTAARATRGDRSHWPAG